MNKPVVSVIIPVHNRPAEVVVAIASVFEQSFSDLEVIVVDDGSTPALVLPEELSKNERLIVVRSDQNKGASAARNTGAEVARGKWLAWLDSDDIWFHDKLSLQMAYVNDLGDQSEHIALACGFEYVDGAGKRDVRIPIAASDPQMFFAGCWFCPGSTVIISRELFERVGPYDEDLHRLEDLDWFARMALAGGRLEVVGKNLAAIRTGQKAPYEKITKAGKILLAKYSGDEAVLPQKSLSNLQAYLHIEYAASALKRDHNRLRGLRHLLSSWRYHPRTRLHIYDFWHAGTD